MRRGRSASTTLLVLDAQSVLWDSGRAGGPFALGVRQALGDEMTVQIAKRSELHKFAVIPMRWVVERSFAWLDKNRRLWKSCERLLNTSLQFVHLAFLPLLLREIVNKLSDSATIGPGSPPFCALKPRAVECQRARVPTVLWPWSTATLA